MREYEASVSTLAESRTEVKRLEGELAEHKAELAALQGEKNLQHTILQKFREQVRVPRMQGAGTEGVAGAARFGV